MERIDYISIPSEDPHGFLKKEGYKNLEIVEHNEFTLTIQQTDQKNVQKPVKYVLTKDTNCPFYTYGAMRNDYESVLVLSIDDVIKGVEKSLTELVRNGEPKYPIKLYWLPPKLPNSLQYIDCSSLTDEIRLNQSNFSQYCDYSPNLNEIRLGQKYLNQAKANKAIVRYQKK